MNTYRALLLIARWIGKAFGLWISALRRSPLVQLAAVLIANQKLRAENDLLRARLLRIDGHSRPHYKPWQRLAILWHRARYGLSLEETARIFVVSTTTLAHWIDEVERGVVHLVQARQPMNRLSDFVRELVHRLKREQWHWGSRRIAGVLAAMGLKASRTSVQRILRHRPPRRRAAAGRASKPKVRRAPIRPKAPRHVYFTDFTKVRAVFGLFSITIGAVVDGFSRKVLAITAWRGEPTARDAQNLLRHAILAGGRPRYLVSDHGCQFSAKLFVRYLKKRKIRHRYGAVGRPQAVARIERFWLTLKTEIADGFLALMPIRRVRRTLESYRRWFNAWRPHGGLRLRSPSAVFAGRRPRRALNPTTDERLVLSVDHIDGHRSLAIYRLHRAA